MTLLEKRKGFTLIEITMVLVILGILAAVATVRFFDMQTEAKTKAAQAAVASAQSAISMGFSLHLVNPSSPNHVAGPAEACTTVSLSGATGVVYTVTCDGDDWDVVSSSITANYDGTTATGTWNRP